MSKNSLELEAIKHIVLTSRKISLYSKNHPIVTQSLTTVFAHLQQLLSSSKKVTLSLRGDDLCLNETTFSRKEVGAQELIVTLKHLQIESVTFSAGLEAAELENFMELLSAGKKLDEKQQKLKDDFLIHGFAHIKANVIHYEKVEEGQKVVSEALKDAEVFIADKEKPESSLKVNALEVLSNFLSGKTDVQTFQHYQKDILDKLIEDPAALAQIIIEAALACGSLTQVFEKLRQCIIEPLADELYSKKRKPDRIIALLERHISAAIDEEQLSGQLKVQKQDVADIFAQFHDELKVLMLLKLFEATKPDYNKFCQRAGKILSNPEELRKLAPLLKQRILNQAMKEQESEEFLAELETSLATSQKVSITKQEYERLKNKAQLFDKTLVEQINQATQELAKKNRRLTDEKERVDNVIRNLADGLIVVDKQGKVVMINPAAEALLGIEKSQKVGRPLTEDLKAHQLIALTKGNLADETDQVSKEIELKSADDKTQRVLRASTAVVENENGNTVGMMMVLSDITRQKQVEKMKTDFVSQMSHELRTPIIAAQKAISLLATQTAGAVNEDQNKFLEIADSNLSRLSRLLNDILDFSKIEAGKITLKPALFNVAELIKEVNQSLASWAQDKKIELIAQVSDEHIELEADRGWISQILINLISNALKFTPEGGKIIVSCQAIQEEQKPCVNFSVTDNGIGIEEKDRERIFNKFEQVSLAVPAGVGGTGLGLAIAREIVQLHKGRIWVDSEIGKGSTFSFVIGQKFSGGVAQTT
jgi:PAS domain S-box-containing protein